MSYEGSSPITSRCPGSQGRQESTHPTPPCLSRACLGWASSSASILLPRELDIHPSTWKENSPKLNFALTEFSEVRRFLCVLEHIHSSHTGVCCVRYAASGGRVKAQDSYLPSS